MSTPPPSCPPPASVHALTLRQRFDTAVAQTTSPGQFLGAAFSAGLNQWQHYPAQWKLGAKGYAARLGYQYAQVIAGHTIELGVSAALHEDPRYYRSCEKKFWNRTRDAIVHTFVISKTDGRPTFAVGRVTSAYGTALLAVQYPGRSGSIGRGLIGGSESLAGDIGTSLFHEFWPEINIWLRKHLPHRK